MSDRSATVGEKSMLGACSSFTRAQCRQNSLGLKFSELSNILSGLYELGTDVRSVSPDYLVAPISCRTVAGNVQHELVWNFDLPKAAQPDASVGCVDHEAKKHPAAVRRLQF